MNLELLLIASAWCIGFHAIVKNIILEVGRYKNIDDWWNPLPKYSKIFYQPLFTCPYCMSSIHGTIIYFATGGSLLMWIPFCVCLCGINYFAVQFFTE